MTTLLVFSVVRMTAVQLSEVIHRSILSGAGMFLVADFLAGGVFVIIQITPAQPIVSGLADFALFSVLFTDGMRTGLILLC
jgi:hypothetical protein